MRQYLYATLALAVVALPAQAAVHASVDSDEVAPGDTVQLTISHDGHTRSQPDLTPLKQDFDIVGRSSSTNVQIVNGSVSASTQLQLSLSPKHTGRLTIPAVTWDSEQTAPLTVEVAGSGTGGGGNTNTANTPADSRVMIETEVSPKEPYVQAAVNVTVRLLAAVPLSHASLDFADTDAAIVRQNGADSNSTEERNGRTYEVFVRHYLVFPQHSGPVSIPGPTLAGEVPAANRRPSLSDPFSDMFGGTPFAGMLGGGLKPIRLHADPIQLNVRPRPAGAGASYWLPARNVSLQGSWHPAQTQVHVGDPISIDLDLKALGLTSAQLPDLSTQLNLPADLKVYPDQPKLKDTPQNGDLLGERDQSVALIADQPGQFVIPDLHLTWWDTQTNQSSEITLPGRTLHVLPAAGSSVPAPAPAQPTLVAQPTPLPASAAQETRTPRRPWLWVSLGFAVLWLATLIAWLRSRRGGAGAVVTSASRVQPEGAGAGAAKAAFQKSCQANDAPGARRNLLAWANAAWGGVPRIQGLNSLAEKVRDPRLTQLLRDLDRACYAGGEWSGDALGTALRDLPKPEPAGAGKQRELAPLYR